MAATHKGAPLPAFPIASSLRVAHPDREELAVSPRVSLAETGIPDFSGHALLLPGCVPGLTHDFHSLMTRG